MAAGTREGDCIVWDLDTKLIVLKLTGHVRQITSVSWTRRGQHILTASRDWNCILWDLATGQRQHTFKFSSPVLEGCVHPRNKNMFVAIATGDPPHLVHYSHDPLVPKKSFSLNVSSNDNESATYVFLNREYTFNKKLMHIFDCVLAIIKYMQQQQYSVRMAKGFTLERLSGLLLYLTLILDR